MQCVLLLPFSAPRLYGLANVFYVILAWARIGQNLILLSASLILTNE